MFLLAFILCSSLSFASPAPKLSRGYRAPHPVIEDTQSFQLADLFRLQSDTLVSDYKSVLKLQSPVKSQDQRGICSIFSAAGALEWLFKKEFKTNLDISENYLAYSIFTKVNHTGDEGSDTPDDIRAASMGGIISEKLWPYDGADWVSKDGQAENRDTIEKVCGGLKGLNKKTCLVTHHNPLEDEFAEDGEKFKEKYKSQYLKHRILYRMSDIKAALDAGQPVVLGLNFFYGAWNHGEMRDVGLGEPNRALYKKGIVGVPTERDIEVSMKEPEGHSIVVIGYNDAEKVYYFKNSWGTDSWGSESPVQKGFGTIAYGYANKQGTFYLVELEK